MTVAPTAWPAVARTMVRTFGARGAALRTLHELRRAAGWFRDAPRTVPADPGSPSGPPFRIDADRLRGAVDVDRALDRAERVLAGEYQAYGWDWRPLPAAPDVWLRHPVTGGIADGSRPWWEVRHVDPELGDIKDLWEPARFGWAYDLVRGFVLTGDDRFAGALHDRLADWLASSPPYRGPHWSCGQEASIRAAALLYAETNLAGAPSSSPQAMERLAGVLAATGERVEDAFGHAISQRNNHAISEATGLVLLGIRFRGRHPRAEVWRRRGRRWLERLVREQIAEDGWYIQHSFTYLRLALDQLVLAQRSLATVGEPLSDDVTARVAAAVELLAWTMDASSGVVPNHGPNDGALVHPVSIAPYRDFRPVLTAVCAEFDLPLPGGVAPDRETLAWLGRDAPRRGPDPGPGVRVGSSGWAAARAGETVVFLRAGRYTARPGHIDPLHVDVRIGGRELVVDPGTLAYTGSGTGDPRLAMARHHNGPLVDDREPAEPGPRFLWLSWPEARVVDADWADGAATIVAERPGVVRRRVRVDDRTVTIRDEALAADATRLRVGWLLHPEVGEEALETDPGKQAPDGADSGRGWFCPTYGRKLASRLVEVRRARPADLVVTTIVRDPADGAGRDTAAGGEA